MNISAAFKLLKKHISEGNYNLWARPLSWRGLGSGVCLSVYVDPNTGDRLLTGHMLVVPSSRGGSKFVPSLEDLLDKWEMIPAGDVLEEGVRRGPV